MYVVCRVDIKKTRIDPWIMCEKHSYNVYHVLSKVKRCKKSLKRQDVSWLTNDNRVLPTDIFWISVEKDAYFEIGYELLLSNPNLSHSKKVGMTIKFLGHLSHSGDLLLWVGVRRRASSIVRRPLKLVWSLK